MGDLPLLSKRNVGVGGFGVFYVPSSTSML